MDCAYCHFKQKSRLCYWTSVAVHLVMIRITVQQIQHSRQIYELQWKTCVLRVDWKEWMDSVSLKWLGREGQGHTWSWLCLQEKFIKSESAMLIGFTANDQCWLSHFPCKNMHVHSTCHLQFQLSVASVLSARPRSWKFTLNNVIAGGRGHSVKPEHGSCYHKF